MLPLRCRILTPQGFIYGHCGIKITDAKRTMLEARLRRRLKCLGLESFTLYCDYLFSPQGMEDELTHMIDQVTTNKTDFFREPAHFDYLSQKALPDLALSKKTSCSGAPGARREKNPIPSQWYWASSPKAIVARLYSSLQRTSPRRCSKKRGVRFTMGRQ